MAIKYYYLVPVPRTVARVLEMRLKDEDSLLTRALVGLDDDDCGPDETYGMCLGSDGTDFLCVNCTAGLPCFVSLMQEE